jgi:hypothetical protein
MALDLYELVESATDGCDDVANMLEAIGLEFPLPPVFHG